VLGGAIVFLRFPGREQERRLLAEYAAEDSDAGAAAPPPEPPPAPTAVPGELPA
jgi:hypothetical protein